MIIESQLNEVKKVVLDEGKRNKIKFVKIKHCVEIGAQKRREGKAFK